MSFDRFVKDRRERPLPLLSEDVGGDDKDPRDRDPVELSPRPKAALSRDPGVLAPIMRVNQGQQHGFEGKVLRP